jgi:hypothetical protein
MSRRPKRQPHVQRQHDCDAVAVIQRGVDEVQHARAQEHAHGRHVVDQAGHQVPRLLLLIVGDRQPLQVGKQVVAQIILDVTANIEDQRA